MASSLNDYAFDYYYAFSTGTALPVDIVSGDTIKVTVGTINAGTIDTLKVGTITTGTIDLLKGGTLAQVTSVSNVASGTLLTLGTVGVINGGTMVMTQPITTSTIANTIAVEGSTVTSVNTLIGMMKGVTIVTGTLEGTGTATVELKDASAGTIFTQAVTEAASPVYYGSIVPLNTGMNWVVTVDGTQSAAATVNLAVHYQK